MPDDFVPLFAAEDALSNVVSSELGAQELAAFASEIRRSYPVAHG